MKNLRICGLFKDCYMRLFAFAIQQPDLYFKVEITCKQTPGKSAALKPKLCCRPKFNLLFENFLRKLLNLLISKQKICSSTENYRVMNHFEYFWAHFSVCQNFQSHFLPFYGQTLVLFWLFCYENQSINKTFFHSAQSAVNVKFCQFCCFLLAADFRGVYL